jgi:hypothetical protein
MVAKCELYGLGAALSSYHPGQNRRTSDESESRILLSLESRYSTSCRLFTSHRGPGEGTLVARSLNHGIADEIHEALRCSCRDIALRLQYTEFLQSGNPKGGMDLSQ